MKTHPHKSLKFVFAFLMLNLLFMSSAIGLNTYNITTNTSWSNISPTNIDIVNVSNGAILTVDVANAQCANLTINNSNNNSNSTVIVDAGNTLTVSGNVSINSGSLAEKSLLTIYGSLIINGNLSIGNSSNSTLDLSGGGTNPTSLLTISGSFTKGAAGIFTAGAASIVNFNGTNAQTIPPLNYNNLTISGERTINNVTLASGTINVAGDYEATTTFTSGGYIVTGNTVILNGASKLQVILGSPVFNNLTISSTGTKNFGSSTSTIAGTFLNTAGSMDGGNSTIIFTGSSGSIAGKSAKYFYHLQIDNGAILTTTSNAGTLNILGDFLNQGTFISDAVTKTNFKGGIIQSLNGKGSSIFGEFSIGSSSTLNSGSFSFTITGNSFNVSGGSTFNGENNTVTFASSVKVSGTGIINFNHLNISSSNQNNLNIKSFSVNNNRSNNGIYEQGKELINYSDSEDNTIASNTEITVDSTLTITSPASLTIESASASVTGSLKINGSASGSGTVHVQRYVPDELNGDDWHIISSPITGTNMLTFAIASQINSNELQADQLITDYDLAPYSEGDQSWSPYLLSNVGGIFEDGRGYAMRRDLSPSPAYITFSGTADNLISGNVGPIEITKSKNGWNALGNPYTSTIDIAGFISGNSGVLEVAPYNGVYVWDPIAGDYQGATLKGNIPVGQGFIVKSKNSTANINFSSSMQEHDATAFKSSEFPWPTINLFVNSEGLGNKTKIMFNETMNNGLDNWYDIGKFKGNPDIALYTQMPDNSQYDLQDQALPNLTSETIRIPVGLDFAPGGEITFTLETEAFPQEKLVYLEDSETGSMTLLNKSGAKYTTFIAAENKGTGRFNLIITKNVLTGVAKINLNLFTAYSKNKTIYINGPVTAKTSFEVYSMDGKCWYKNYAQNMSLNRINGSAFPTGVYLLRIKQSGVVQTTKLVLTEN